eukprot:Sdes_comp17837_c0_seq2m7110
MHSNNEPNRISHGLSPQGYCQISRSASKSPAPVLLNIRGQHPPTPKSAACSPKRMLTPTGAPLGGSVPKRKEPRPPPLRPRTPKADRSFLQRIESRSYMQ